MKGLSLMRYGLNSIQQVKIVNGRVGFFEKLLPFYVH